MSIRTARLISHFRRCHIVAEYTIGDGWRKDVAAKLRAYRRTKTDYPFSAIYARFARSIPRDDLESLLDGLIL